MFIGITTTTHHVDADEMAIIATHRKPTMIVTYEETAQRLRAVVM